MKNPNIKLRVENSGNYLNVNISKVERDKFATVIVLETTDEVIVYNGPKISAEYSVFIDKAAFEITTDIPNCVIRYTTDGSVPSKKSAIAKGINGVTLSSSFLIKALCFRGESAISGLTEKRLSKEEPLPAIAVQETKSGLEYRYFEGIWGQLPDFSVLKPMSKGIAQTIDLTMKKRNSDYGLIFSGYLQVPETAVYQFYLTSNDGSQMIIGGKTLSNDGLHGMDQKSMDFALSKGFHPIEIQFFQAGGGDGLKLEWKAKGKDRAVIDCSYLKHQ